MRGHDGAFVCKLCSKAYRSRSALKFHIQKHNEEPKRIFCDFCQKLFDSEKALKMHKRCHSKQPNSPACLGEKYDSNNATKNRIQFSICSEKVCNRIIFAKYNLLKLNIVLLFTNQKFFMYSNIFYFHPKFSDWKRDVV